MKTKNKIIISFTAVILLLFFLLPLPYYVEKPGTAQPTNQIITVNKKHDVHKGQLLFTTVELMRGTPFNLLIASADPFQTIRTKSQEMGNANSKEYQQMQSYFMETASNDAIEAAFRKAHKSYSKKYLGVYVMTILKNSDFKHSLKVGDVINKIDGHSFNSSEQFITTVKKDKVGQKVTVDYLRNGQKHTATKKLVSIDKTHRPGLGIGLVNHTKIESKPTVKIDAKGIGGPSAGLMFSLQIYSQLNDINLTHGDKIAGTGTIAPDGQVGPIGGIDKKVYAASKQGAKIFFAPNDKITKEDLAMDPHYKNNYKVAKQAAKRLNTNMKIVPVTKLDDTINYLKTHQ